MRQFYDLFSEKLKKGSCFVLFLNRLVLAAVFISAGWGKFHNLDHVVGFFSTIGIPAANIQAPMVAAFELVGGVMIFAGFWTRLISIPLSIIMVVALATAHAGDIANVMMLLKQAPFLYLLLFLTLMVTGPGKISLDAFLKWEK